MGTIIVNGGNVKVGCTDPMASNYDPTATTPCNGCCEYGVELVGCLDPLATNYNPSATVECNGCCTYGETLSTGTGLSTGFGGFGGISNGSGEQICPGPFAITIDGEVLGVTSSTCCNELVIGEAPPGYSYYWDSTSSETAQGGKCFLLNTCPPDITCVDCNSFDWWNDTYIANHNGQSLSVSSPTLWLQIVDLVSNSGQTFYVQTSTGELISQSCCPSANGTFKDGICFCTVPIVETFEPSCISNLNEFIAFVSTTEGYNYFVANGNSLAGALGLTVQQITFIINNLFNTNDNNSNGIPDQTEARLIISNALNITGGFYVNFGTVTNTPQALNKGICDSIGGYWDTVPAQCMCQPLVNQCDIDITEVQVVTTTDFYGNTIQIVEYNPTNNETVNSGPIGEACCNRLINDYNLPWVWQGQRCYAVPVEDCLPVVFTLNDKPMNVPPCENDLELSMWVYFGKPANPCQPIPDPPDDDDIIIDGEFCDITLTPNTGSIVNNPGSNPIDFGTGTAVDVDLDGNIGTNRSVGESVVIPTVCCYSNLNPILARITLTNPILNPYLVQVKEYNSNTDYFNRWVQIKATLPSSGLTLNFGVNLEIYQGLNCCCLYDIFVDDIRVSCSSNESLLIVNDIKCPGFELNRVIDNKKSWVYNPGTPEVGISDYDNIERADGSFGMLNGEGIINRTFAPSLDADIPWRYTDYFKQSSVYERHSNLVLNTKELGLTFDMCADCPISGTSLGCPDGYTFSGNTLVCYKCETGATETCCVTVNLCPSGYTDTGSNCVIYDYTTATCNGTGCTIYTAATLPMSAWTSGQGQAGGVFYEDITGRPLVIHALTGGSGTVASVMEDGVNAVVNVVNNQFNTLWGGGFPLQYSRLNEVGIWTTEPFVGPELEWVGFSSCIEIPETKTYVMGMAADDGMRVSLNGQLLFDYSTGDYAWSPWRMFPMTLSAGTNVFKIEGIQAQFFTPAFFGFEIYDASVNTLTGLTTTIGLDPYILFSTKDLAGLEFNVGEDSGYSCPSGYTLCSGSCVNVLTTGYTSSEVVCNYVTTSAITVDTVTYLSLYNLENYKKTFQSFWIPFMEQFIPATTIWVAGERWCAEPCTIIEPCDYDFELTDAEISINPVPPGFFPSTPGKNVGTSTLVATSFVSFGTSVSPSFGTIPTETPNILTITNIGLVTTSPNIPTEEMVNVDFQEYRNKFTASTTQRIIRVTNV